jgi:hypothetical protein
MGETTEAYEEAPMTPEQEIAYLKKRIENQRELLIESRRNERRYNTLKRLEVVIMDVDGAKYLKGDEYDEYLDGLPFARQGGPLRSAQFIKEATPVLNEVFAKEYAKYVDEHAEHIAAHIDAEALRNVKT